MHRSANGCVCVACSMHDMDGDMVLLSELHRNGALT